MKRQSKCDGCRIKSLKDTYKTLSVDTNKMVVTTSIDAVGNQTFRQGTPTFEGESAVTVDMCIGWIEELTRLRIFAR